MGEELKKIGKIIEVKNNWHDKVIQGNKKVKNLILEQLKIPNKKTEEEFEWKSLVENCFKPSEVIKKVNNHQAIFRSKKKIVKISEEEHEEEVCKKYSKRKQISLDTSNKKINESIENRTFNFENKKPIKFPKTTIAKFSNNYCEKNENDKKISLATRLKNFCDKTDENSLVSLNKFINLIARNNEKFKSEKRYIHEESTFSKHKKYLSYNFFIKENDFINKFIANK